MKSSRYIFIGITLIIVVWIGYFLFSNTHAIVPFINSTLMIAVPLVLGAILARRLKVDWRLFGVGAATFVLSQVLHIPFNQFVLNPYLVDQGWRMEAGTTGLIWISVFLGLSAGVFEEVARFIAYKTVLKKERRWKDSLMFGAGHGGTEAMIFGALALYTFLQLVILKDMNAEQLLQWVDPENVDQTLTVIQTYWASPWYDYLLPLLERLSAMTLHLSLAVMVWRSIAKRQVLWFIAAIAWHAIVDAVAVYSITTWSAYLTEALIFAMALVSLGIIFWLREDDPDEEPDSSVPPPPALQPQRITPELTQENLEDSRYD